MEPFKKEQASITIGNVTLGGQPGEHPTCMIGTMFYKSHSIITDPKAGTFDREAATTQLREMESISKETGLPFIVDVVGDSPDRLVKYCQFVADTTENKQQPFLMDGLSDEIRVPALKQLVDSGLRSRLVYNSIEPKITDATIDAIKECKVEQAVLLAFDSTMLLPAQKARIIEGWDDKAGPKEGLLEKARRAGVGKCIVDVAVLDMPSVGIAARTIRTVKERWGIPAGCAPSNAIFECAGTKRFGATARATSISASCAFLASAGADFILFGPVKHCNNAFLATASIDAFLGYAGRRIDKIKPSPETHPLFKIF